MHRQHVQRSIKRLIQLGIILEGVKIGISRSYRLNPSFGWKGSAKGHREVSARALEGYQVIRGRRAHGAALATLATCAHLSPDNQARLHRAGSVPCKPKTPKPLNECLRHTVPYCATPKGLANTVGAAHTSRSPRGRGAGENLLHPYHRALSPPTCKGQAASGCFASLDRFPAPSASDRFATHGGGEGSRAAKPCILPLTPWSRPNTSPQGQVVGF